MGLMEEFGAWLDQKKKNIAVNAQNLPGLLSSFAQDVQQGAAADKSSFDAARSVMPSVREAGIREMNARGQELGGLLGAIKAFHGSPHKFDKFDLSKIGTGEGAQAYGHGLYMAENPNVAKEYAKVDPSVAPPPNRALLGKELTPGTPEYHAGTLLESMSLPKARQLVATWIAEGSPDKNLVEGWKVTLDTLNKVSKKSDFKVLPNTNLYEASIRWPDAAREAADPLGPQHFLDWDKPLSEQPKPVRKVLSKEGVIPARQDAADYLKSLPKDARRVAKGMLDDNPDNLTNGVHDADWGTLYQRAPNIDHNKIHDINSQIADWGTGEKLYRELVNRSLGDKFYLHPDAARAEGFPAATEKLRQLGIPGIRYLDGGSRGAGQGTHNYVVFDDNLLEILKRNGQPLGLLAP